MFLTLVEAVLCSHLDTGTRKLYEPLKRASASGAKNDKSRLESIDLSEEDF